MVGPAGIERLEPSDHGLRRPFQLLRGEEDMPERHRLRRIEPRRPAIDPATQYREVTVKDLVRYRLACPQGVPQLREPGGHLCGTAAHPPGDREDMSQRYWFRRIHPFGGPVQDQVFEGRREIPSHKTLVGRPGDRQSAPTGHGDVAEATGGRPTEHPPVHQVLRHHGPDAFQSQLGPLPASFHQQTGIRREAAEDGDVHFVCPHQPRSIARCNRRFEDSVGEDGVVVDQ